MEEISKDVKVNTYDELKKLPPFEKEHYLKIWYEFKKRAIEIDKLEMKVINFKVWRKKNRDWWLKWKRENSRKYRMKKND